MSKDAFQADRCAPLLKALADPIRLRMVDLLRAGKKNVGEIAEELGIEVVNASHHLGVLKHAGLVECERDGRHQIYHLVEDVLPAPTKGDSGNQIDLGCCQILLQDIKPPPRK